MLRYARQGEEAFENVLGGRVTGVREGEVHLDALLEGGRGARLAVSLTRTSAEELGLRPGLAVHLVFKTQSSRVLSNLRAPEA